MRRKIPMNQFCFCTSAVLAPTNYTRVIPSIHQLSFLLHCGSLCRLTRQVVVPEWTQKLHSHVDLPLLQKKGSRVCHVDFLEQVGSRKSVGCSYVMCGFWLWAPLYVATVTVYCSFSLRLRFVTGLLSFPISALFDMIKIRRIRLVAS